MLRVNHKPARTGPQTAGIVLSGDRVGESILSKQLAATYDTYRTIRRHPTVAFARALTIAPILASEWSYESKDGTPDAWVRFIQDAIAPRRLEILETSLGGGIDYGWAPFELIFESQDGLVGLAAVKPLLVDLTEIRVDSDTGEFRGFRQQPSASATVSFGQTIELEPEYCLLVSFRVEGQQYYGQALLENLRTAYESWVETNAAARRYDTKIAGAYLLLHYPTGTIEINGEVKGNSEVAGDLLRALVASNPIYVPRRVESSIEGTAAEEWKLDILSDAGAKQTSFIERLSYTDKLFVRGLLMPERAVLEGEYGTKAEAGVHASIALLQREVEHRHVVDALNHQVVDRLLTLNFGPDAAGTVHIEAAPLANEQAAFFRELYRLVLAHPLVGADALEALDIDALMDAVGAPKVAEVMQLVSPGARPAEPNEAGSRADIRRQMGAAIERLHRQARKS